MDGSSCLCILGLKKKVHSKKRSKEVNQYGGGRSQSSTHGAVKASQYASLIK